ncbi:CPXCG motif-containing cysteine-rich protein [Paraglaciecola sp. L3A3]|uniref:CPXCG motif-containing cysteine-rich protein n=1 Tax=Paraglaciecola sp. L3A3 TaxID=2686358 RepID=UPI00131C2050|nr:CPXCG motif-containing cysteine-rich protein [Paraglaciecola sp. L3A3]
MSLITNSEFSCPYCMEINEIKIDQDNDMNKQPIIDCKVCCSSIEIVVTLGIHDPYNIIASTDSE